MRFLIGFSVILLGLMASVCFANETSNRFGDRSWQFDTPNDKIAKQNSLILYCQQSPQNCNRQSTTATDRTITPPSGGGDNNGGGANLGGGDSIIGNNVTVVIDGDGNVVEITGDQSLNDSPQTLDHNVSDNNVTTVVEEPITERPQTDSSN